MQSILSLARKDLKLLFRDKFALFWIFAFPLMYSLFFGTLFGDSGDGSRGTISIRIVDEEPSDDSQALVERLANHESLRVPANEDGSTVTHGLDEAREDVRKGRATAYLRIPAGYDSSPFALFGGGGGGGDDAQTVEVGIDPSRSAEAGFLQGILMETLFGGLGEQFTDADSMMAEITSSKESIAATEGMDPAQQLVLQQFMTSLESFYGEIDFDEEEAEGEGGGGFDMGGQVSIVDVARDAGNRPRTAFDITFPSAMVWGLLGVAVSFAVTLVKERTEGTLLRLRIAPIGHTELLAGKAVACFTTCLIVMFFLMAFSFVALGVRFGSYPLALASMLCTAACFTGIMMLASVMGKTEQAVAGSAWGVMMPFMMVGGGMIPLIAMPAWLVKVSNISPFKWGIYSMEGAVWRGFSAGDMLLPCGILLGTGAVFFAIGVWAFKWTSD
jgi:ABC-2 type transport system permease protein